MARGVGAAYLGELNGAKVWAEVALRDVFLLGNERHVNDFLGIIVFYVFDVVPILHHHLGR